MRTLLVWVGLFVGSWALVILAGVVVTVFLSDLIERAY
jgi:hypothetical protein